MRAMTIELGGGTATLVEHVEAHYYHPLGEPALDTDGRYELEFEGRFAAQMAFSRRGRETIGLDTLLRLTPAEDHLLLELDVDGPAVALAWGISGPGARLQRLDDDAHWQDCALDAGAASYNPGEAYSFLGGTDAPTQLGSHVFMAPGRSTWRIIGPRPR